jgi:hypothetical protein
MLRRNDKKQDTPSERSLKRVLSNSGFSEPVADKISKWYNPPELNDSEHKK